MSFLILVFGVLAGVTYFEMSTGNERERIFTEINEKNDLTEAQKAKIGAKISTKVKKWKN